MREGMPGNSIISRPLNECRTTAAFHRPLPWPFSVSRRGAGQRAAGADAGEHQTLLVQRQVEEAEHDAVDQEVESGGAGLRSARIRR